ncbi:lamin tail domain-containing protein [Candidatus Woesearchaeota archaeon]|nr:lamin tail domain-containing protein [Candidatus Woesearchaeota archaeon]
MALISWLALFSLITAALTTASLEINEVMYAPSEGHEWVELYNPTDQPINLSGWLITDNKNTDELICCFAHSSCALELAPRQYALVLEQDDLVNINNSAALICVDDNSIGNGLGNNGDNITISKGDYQLTARYTRGQGANKNGRSLEKDGSSWHESYALGGTPGRANSQPIAEETTAMNAAAARNSSELNSSELNISSEATEETVDVANQDAASQDTANQPSETAPAEKINPSFKILNFKNKVLAGDLLPIEFQITAGSSSHEFSVWSYLYRGNKCYSCGDAERKGNLQKITLKANQEKIITFNLDLPLEIEPGEYFLKVRAVKDQQKTTTDFKEKVIISLPDISLLEPEEELKPEEAKLSAPALVVAVENTALPTKTSPPNPAIKVDSVKEISSKVVYESKGRKIKNLIPYLLVIAFGSVAILLVLKPSQR